MRCFHPLTGYRLSSGKILFQKPTRGAGFFRDLQLPCGQCIGCRLKTAESWVVRCMHERRMHEDNCAVTLTYDGDKLPYRGDLVYDHFQLFMRYLRRKLGPCSFYMCGEYGTESERPHFHACLFGVRFGDGRRFATAGDGSHLFTSKTLSSLWGKGHATFGDLSAASAAYIARYVTKKVTGDRAHDHYLRCDGLGEAYWLTPEFTRMSLRPAIGKRFWDKYKTEVLVRDRCVIDGKFMRVPRYYDELLAREAPLDIIGLKNERIAIAKAHEEDCTAARLAVQEVVVKAKFNLKSRGL